MRGNGFVCGDTGNTGDQGLRTYPVFYPRGEAASLGLRQGGVDWAPLVELWPSLPAKRQGLHPTYVYTAVTCESSFPIGVQTRISYVN